MTQIEAYNKLVSTAFKYVNERRDTGETEFWKDFEQVRKENGFDNKDGRDLFYIACKHYRWVDDQLLHGDAFFSIFQQAEETKK